MTRTKTIHYVLISLTLLLSLSVFLGCEKKEMIKFKGKVIDTEGKEVPYAKVTAYVWGERAKKPKRVVIDLKGGRIIGELPKGKKYVVNIRARGYGLVSKVFYNSLPERTYELKQAT